MMAKYDTLADKELLTYDTGAQREDSSRKPNFTSRLLSEWNKFASIPTLKNRLHINRDSPAQTGMDDTVRIFKSAVGYVSIHMPGKEAVRVRLTSELMLNRLEALLQRGAEKYSPNNWRKGLSLAICFASAMRHLLQWRFGGTDEDHLAAAICNIMFIMDIENDIAQGDLPDHLIDGCGVLAQHEE